MLSTCFGFIFHSVQWFLNLCQGAQKELAKNSTHTCFHMLYKIASVFQHVINSFLIIPSDKGDHDSRIKQTVSLPLVKIQFSYEMKHSGWRLNIKTEYKVLLKLAPFRDVRAEDRKNLWAVQVFIPVITYDYYEQKLELGSTVAKTPCAHNLRSQLSRIMSPYWSKLLIDLTVK